MSIRNSILVRARLAFLAVLVFAIVIIYRLMVIQFVEGDKWLKIAKENGLRYIEVEATRGNILADKGNLLATSLPFYKVAFDPLVSSDQIFSEGIDSLSVLLADFFQDKTQEEYLTELKEAREGKRRYKVLSRNFINYQDKKEMSKWPIFKEGRHKGGIIFEKVEKRFKPFESLGRRTIGFTRSDSIGEIKGVGLEYSFNEKLAGVNGEALYQRISGGRWKPLNDLNDVDASQLRPENGYDIETTLDIDLQEYATNSLKKALKLHKADYGTVILMEVETGEIKAMVNLGETKKGAYDEIYNYAVGSQGVAEPGSTFKLASMMAILEESNVNITDTVNTGDGEYMFYEDCIMKDATIGGYGQLSIQEVFEKSSNIGMSKLVFRIFSEKPSKYVGYLKKFGLTDPLGFQMIGEGVPFVGKPGEETWSGCSLPWMSIGYELKLSPLQILAFYNAVANDGKMIEPIIVKKILRGNQVVNEYYPRILSEKLCSDNTLFTLQGMLEGVVERGTANNIKTEQYKIAGKTGTTHKLNNGEYIKKYYTSFAGYFPADNPKYSCIVVIDDPKAGEKYGGKVAAPVFREIADKVYTKKLYQEVEHDILATESLPYIQAGNYKDLTALSDEFNLKQMSFNTGNWVRSKVQGDTIEWHDNVVPESKVPDVRGMTLRDALYILENQGLRVKTYGRGRVEKQSILPGRVFKKGNTIFLSLS